MKPIEILGREPTADGEELVLTRRDGVVTLFLSGMELMSSRAPGSERALAERGLAGVAGRRRPRVLIGGLGLGFTLRAALDRLPEHAEVVVAELSAMVVAAVRGELAELAGRPLEDPRTTIFAGDVAEALVPPARYDAILLDTDDGPRAHTHRANRQLYDAAGLRRLRGALSPGGQLAIWSAAPDAEFVRRLGAAGFLARAETVRARPGGRAERHTLFLALVPARGRVG